MPFLTRNVTTEADGLATFGRQQVHQIVTTLHALDDQQLRATPSASELSVGAIAHHVLAVVDGNAHEIERATARAARAVIGDEPVIHAPGEDDDPELGDPSLSVPDGATAATLGAALEQAGTRLEEALRAADLDAPVPTPEAPWYTGAEDWNVRWLALHTIEEVARHAGQADVIRESIDGKGAYELNALTDGETWPPAGW
ncbi:DUF664 domain-containing protein [Brachybacterium sp. J144]|uniref:mycothiol transferase n=1 Tax=Brachybacterium sp. J144 TaxID=3116487 RepID=UPI002E7979B8|nr:DUF664 domain-containing protein [Brachybacterium sp. J144]MEE1650219.1 DUF664 domain-containing protein [Brachybacterium sp. J144]